MAGIPTIPSSRLTRKPRSAAAGCLNSDTGCGAGRNPQPHTMKAPAHYHTLKAACLPLITAYHRDLLMHDRRFIRAHPQTPFLHVTREYGTYLDMLHPASHYPPQGKEVRYLFGYANRQQILDQVGSGVNYASKHHPDAVIHYFDGKTLRRITYAQAAPIVEAYQKAIRREWVENPFNRQLQAA